MKAYKCDRCGRFFEVPTEDGLYYIVGMTKNGTLVKESETVTIYDICPKCAEDFRRWIKKQPRKKKVAPEYNPSLNGGFVFEEVG